MTNVSVSAVVIDRMAVSALVNASRRPELAAGYSSLIAGRSIKISFNTVTEMRYGALRAGWGELRRRGLERDLGRFVVVQPDGPLVAVCAELRASCEAKGQALGQKVHEADRWIAATAVRLGVELVSDDGGFQNVEGLVVRSRRDG